MPGLSKLSEGRQALLKEYLRGTTGCGATKRAGIPRRAGSGLAPLSYGQQQIWLHSQLAGGISIYNEPVTIHRHGALDRSALERSFADVVRRHEAWRTTFEWRTGNLVQIVHPAPATLEIPFHDLRAWPAPERAREAIRLATEDALPPFDLGRGPLYRARLVRLGDEEHRLFLTLHHIIFDGVSLYRIFLPELQALYDGYIHNEPASLRDLPIQYADYAVWQRNSVEQVLPKQVDYWRTVFKDLPRLDLEADHPRPPVETYAGAMETLKIPASAAAALKALATEHRATLFMTMVAGFMTLLHGYTGQEDIAIGSASSGRHHTETEGLLGFFLNTIVIRCAFFRDLPFTDLLARVRNATLEALSNDDVPFELLVQKFAGERNPSRGHLFQALISVEPPLAPLREGWEFTQMDVETGAAKFDLHLELDDRPEGLIGRLIYNTALFERSTVQLLKSRWLKLLDRVIANPASPLSDLVEAAWSERTLEGSAPQDRWTAKGRPVPVEWNRTARPFPGHQGIHRTFEETAVRAPQAVAIRTGEWEVSYAELNAQANRLARHLRSIGIARGMCVGTCLDRSPELVTAILGILKAGGAYVPLDAEYPAERLADMVVDAGISQVLTLGDGASALAGTKVALIDMAKLDLAAEEPTDLDLPGTGEDLAYVMFTSGSAGRPKGAEILHRGIARLVVNNDFAPFASTDVVAFAANVCFDASTFEIWGALLNGGTLVVTPRDVLLSPSLLASHLAAHRISVLFLTTSLFNHMVALSPGMFAGLRHLVFGGEAAEPQAVREVLQHGKPQRLVNGYGPTEATTFAVCHTIESVEGDRIPIGRPIANTEVFILDPALQPVAIGVLGELCIGGPGVARGYVNAPELTAASFLATPHGRLYRTGDLAQWLPDGNIDFLGRSDWQFKRRGFRIEPGEIEAQLRRHPAIAQCVVLPKTGPSDETAPVAYLVRRPEHPPVADADFRQYLVENLPSPFVPYQWFWLEALPLTAHGKLDHRALPEPSADAKSTQQYVPPQNSVHSHFIEIWEEVLQRKPIGIRDNFFDLGGHSLIAAKIVALISERLGHRLSFGEFFGNPTIEQHALGLTGGRSPVRQTHSVAIHPEGKKTPVFFFHGDFVGGGFFCKTLANVIGADRPFYALHPHGLQGDDVPLTIEAMATDRVKQIREIQPHGPYILGGYCNGSLTAYHAARILRACGEEVSVLLMLFSECNNTRFRWLKRLTGFVSDLRGEDEAAALKRFLHIRRRYRDREDMARYYLRAVADLIAHPSRDKAAPFLRKAGRLFGAKSAASPGGGNGRTPPAAPDGVPRGSLSEPYADACRAFIPDRYDSPVILLWPRDEKPRTRRGPAEGWEKICRHYEVVEVPGHHHSCVSQNSNVVLIGEAMRKAIDQAERLLSKGSS